MTWLLGNLVYVFIYPRHMLQASLVISSTLSNYAIGEIHIWVSLVNKYFKANPRSFCHVELGITIGLDKHMVGFSQIDCLSIKGVNGDASSSFCQFAKPIVTEPHLSSLFTIKCAITF